MAIDSPDERLVGIAKLAAESTTLASKGRVEYFELPTGRYITRCGSTRVPFQWTINPYRGCEFGCKYCYARYTHEFMELRDPIDFERKIFAKMWDPAAFRKEMRRIEPGEWIGIGTATDPYQPAEKRFGVTRKMLGILAGERGRRISLTTKSNLVTRDTGLLARIAAENIVHVAVSITTPDTALARLIEPLAPRPDLRMKAVEALSRAGLQVAVLACPLLPLLNDGEEGLDLLARQAAAAGAASFTGGVVFLKPCTHETVFPFLEQQFPRLVAPYRKYFGRRAFVGGSYQRKVAATLERVRRRRGLPARIADSPPPGWGQREQLAFEFERPAHTGSPCAAGPPNREAQATRIGAGRNSIGKSSCRSYAASL